MNKHSCGHNHIYGWMCCAICCIEPWIDKTTNEIKEKEARQNLRMLIKQIVRGEGNEK